ncbi:hypothetical protein ACIQGZ_17350 [Streptomyces sp. NPDC092296]|uniref:hypothetical protein n=1 Tax=Streptomyces sp. NPDC092296 TaxID=3366012 RepID=UPI00381879DC
MTEPPIPPAIPPSWPDAVQPPGTQHWEQTATTWLWTHTPTHLRQHRILTDRPLLLARITRQTADGQLAAMRAGYRTAHPDFADTLPAGDIDALLGVYTVEGHRLRDLATQAGLVEDALRGVRWRPGTGGPGRRRGGMG